MDWTMLLAALIGALGGGGLSAFVVLRNVKVDADMDTISKLRLSHDAGVLEITDRMRAFSHKMGELHDEIEALHEEIRTLRKMMADAGQEPPPRRKRPPGLMGGV